MEKIATSPQTTYTGNAAHGVTSYDAEAKRRLAKLANTTPDKLHAFTITTTGCNSNRPFYDAILKYVGLYDILSGQNETSCLAIEALQRHERSSPEQILRRHRRSRLFGDAIEINAGIGEKNDAESEKKKVAFFFPSTSYGLGDSVVSWPPPSELESSNIISMHEKNDPDYYTENHLEFAYDMAFHNPKKILKGEKLTPNDTVHVQNGAEADLFGSNPLSSYSNCKLERVTHNGDTLNGEDHYKNDKNEKAYSEESRNALEDDKYWRKTPKNNIYISHYTVGDIVADFGHIELLRELTICCTGDIRSIYDFCRGVLQWQRSVDKGKTEASSFELYRFRIDPQHKKGKWDSDGIKAGRQPSSVILESDCMNLILNDARNFYSGDTRAWYKEHGVPHRRAYLFHGPPGTGKTSTIRVIASDLQLTACFLHFASSDFTNQMLADALRDIPENALLVIEDVDSLFNENREGKSSADQALTFSGLLNALDGLISADGILTIMTSNHPDKLDKALVRAGRVDRSFLFDRPTRKAIGEYFRTFYKENVDQSIVDKFVEQVWSCDKQEKARNISTLQQVFISFRGKSAEYCANGAKEYLDSMFKADEGEKDKSSA